LTRRNSNPPLYFDAPYIPFHYLSI
jgi:hypothetical protein